MSSNSPGHLVRRLSRILQFKGWYSYVVLALPCHLAWTFRSTTLGACPGCYKSSNCYIAELLSFLRWLGLVMATCYCCDCVASEMPTDPSGAEMSFGTLVKENIIIFICLIIWRQGSLAWSSFDWAQYNIVSTIPIFTTSDQEASSNICRES